jgi:hypothetical protein
MNNIIAIEIVTVALKNEHSSMNLRRLFIITSHIMNLFRSIIFLLIITLFIGCGGGGGSSPSFSISGTVSGAVSSGVTVTLSGARSGTATTDATGNYTFKGLVKGSYTITPSLSGYVFDYVSEAVTINGTNITSINFTSTASKSPTYNISGTVTLSSGEALSGLIVTLSGNVSGTVATDSNGNYTFTGLSNGSYTIAPSLAGYIFNPTQLAVDINGADATSNDFIAKSQTYSISGTVTWDSGGVSRVLEDVNVMLAVTCTSSTVTDSNGNYTFKELPDGFYRVTTSLKGYSFNAASVGIQLNGANATSINFVGVKD